MCRKRKVFQKLCVSWRTLMINTTRCNSRHSDRSGVMTLFVSFSLTSRAIDSFLELRLCLERFSFHHLIWNSFCFADQSTWNCFNFEIVVRDVYVTHRISRLQLSHESLPDTRHIIIGIIHNPIVLSRYMLNFISPITSSIVKVDPSTCSKIRDVKTQKEEAHESRV